MKKFLLFVVGIVFMVLSTWCLTSKPTNEPLAMSKDLYPSCHWDGTQDKNDWKTVFSDFRIDPKTKKWSRVWEQTVAKGISEEAAEKLCDAFVTTRANTNLEK